MESDTDIDFSGSDIEDLFNTNSPESRGGRAELNAKNDVLDQKYGYETFSSGPKRLGWLLNLVNTTVPKIGSPDQSGLDCFFIEQNGNLFKSTLIYRPYFYIATKKNREKLVAGYLERKYRQQLSEVVIIEKLDLDKIEHIVGDKSTYLRLLFHNVSDLMEVRSDIQYFVKKNTSSDLVIEPDESDDLSSEDPTSAILDIREFDVPYLARVCIDLNIRVGCWYEVVPEPAGIRLLRQEHILTPSNPKVFAFDIETSKAPLKFPDATKDAIYMISIMIDGQGVLIINREIVSKDISDFEFTPHPDYKGPFHVFNEPSEEQLLRRFYAIIETEKPNIFVTFNGDFFDWPFVRDRSQLYGINLQEELGIREVNGEFRGRASVHLDAFAWVKRDSYLPHGSQGLKAVTKAKLGFDPIEINAEDMLRFAVEDSFYMASYSVSDAVSTYYLYMKYVHLFIYSLCTVLPLNAEDVLRKGSGTLCEMLLMVESFNNGIIYPNKQIESPLRFFDGHLLESDSYIGGTVECLESGVYRNDLPSDFAMDASAFEELIAAVDQMLTFSIEMENGLRRHDIANYDEIRQKLVYMLELLRDRPTRRETPVIYHLDVGAMYPNIILSNRLQPSAITCKERCASCPYRSEESNCLRAMAWRWRGEYFPLKRQEFDHLRSQYQLDKPQNEEALPAELKRRVREYCRTVYGKQKETKIEMREAWICQREHPFYVNTIKAFRDRRYEWELGREMRSRYKKLTKVAVKKVAAAKELGDISFD